MVTERDVLVAHAHHLELLRRAEQERLARQVSGAKTGAVSRRALLYRLGCLLVALGRYLQKAGGRLEPPRRREATAVSRR